MSDDFASRKILLIGWDAADWKFINPLLDGGLMPNLSKLVDGGVMASLASLKPCLSPILWNSIATGKTADKHGITGFVEPIPGGGGIRLSSSTSRRTKAIWNILSQSDRRCVVINWYASYPAEPISGCCVSNRFFEGLPNDPNLPWDVVPDSVYPPQLGNTISGFRMHPAELSCEDLARFIPDLAQIDLTKDVRPTLLAKELAKTVSVHSVATGAMKAEAWDFLAVYYDGLDTIGHHFMPYHPPRLPSISEMEFTLFQHVMRELYLFHDEMLGRLLELAGDETTVILLSDHGFHCDHLRPQQRGDGLTVAAEAASWHRSYGILAMRGTGLLKDERIYGASLLDITPTILTMLDLPVGQDMDGRPLLQAFQSPVPEPETIKSWDLRPGNDGRHAAEAQQTMTQSPEAIAQLVALGYLPPETAETQKAIDIAVAESKFNLAIVHADHRRLEDALQLFDELHQQDPTNARYALAVAKAAANLKDHHRCLAVINKLEASGQSSAESDLLAVAELFNSGQTDEASKRLADVELRYPSNPSLFSLVGQVNLGLGRWQTAFDSFAKAVELDMDDPHSHHGLAVAANKLGDHANAAEYALQAIGLLFFFPRAHFQLGLAIKGMDDIPRAIRSFDLAVTQAPGFREAHQELANLYQRINNVPLWLNHQRLAKGLPPLA